MATLTASFRTETGKVHLEHQILAQMLRSLDAALDELVCYAEVFADLASAERVCRYGRQLVEKFPEHCRREEELVLGPVSEVSPELAEFCGEMKNEHAALMAQLATFGEALGELEKAEDLSEAVCHLKERGKALTSELRRHVAYEERELSGFL